MDGPKVDLYALYPELKGIEEEILNGSYRGKLKERKGAESWGGADVLITNDSTVSDDWRVVNTRFPSEVAWFFDRVKGIAYKSELIDYNAKFQFFRNLASVVRSYDQEPVAAQRAEGLLLALLEAVGAQALKWSFGQPE